MSQLRCDRLWKKVLVWSGKIHKLAEIWQDCDRTNCWTNICLYHYSFWSNSDKANVEIYERKNNVQISVFNCFKIEATFESFIKFQANTKWLWPPASISVQILLNSRSFVKFRWFLSWEIAKQNFTKGGFLLTL